MARRHNIETRLTATDKTKAAFNRVQRRMKSLKKASLVAGGGIAAVGASFAVAAKRAVNFGDDIAKTSDQIGISTKAFQELRFAADLAGVSEEKFGSGLAKLAKNIGEFREGTGTLVTFLNKLGDESFANLLRSTTDTEQAFRAFIKRMDVAANSQQKLALANAAFGRGVGQMLAGLSFKELEDGIRTAREFGIVIEDKLLREAEKIKDAFTLVAAVLKKEFFSEILRSLRAMDLPKFAKDMAKLAAATVKFVRAIGEWFGIIEKADTPLQTLKTDLATTNSLIRALTDPRGRAAPVGQLGLQEWAKELSELRFKAAFLRDEIKKLKTLKVPIDKGTKKEPKQQLGAGLFDGSDKENALSLLIPKLEKYREEIAKTTSNLTELNNKQFKSVEAMDIEAQRLETTRNVRKFINDLREKGLGISRQFEEAVIREANAVDELNRKLAKKKELLEPGPIQEYIDRTKDLNTSLQEVAVRGADALTESLIGIMDGTQKASDGFKSMARSIIADMQKLIIKKMFLDQVMGWVGSMLPGAKPGAKTKPKAKGGPVGTGRPYIVGEKGPELLVPRRNGHIVPNHAMGGAVVNQTINIETGVSQTVRAEIMQLMPQINESTKAAILDARRRGGSFADGFA
ncbi:MAG: hypothetical protein CMP14_08410 [Rickettsiales bacterium]|mgnify:CR=1 FL=1|nr:hypothetical protein [Rickettsiales bacterium]